MVGAGIGQEGVEGAQVAQRLGGGDRIGGAAAQAGGEGLDHQLVVVGGGDGLGALAGGVPHLDREGLAGPGDHAAAIDADAAGRPEDLVRAVEGGGHRAAEERLRPGGERQQAGEGGVDAILEAGAAGDAGGLLADQQAGDAGAIAAEVGQGTAAGISLPAEIAGLDLDA